MMVLSEHLQPEDAMRFAERFVAAFDSGIVSVLSCFDRVVFKGYLPFGGDGQLNSWVDYALKMKRKDFVPWLDHHSQALVDHAQALAALAGRPYVYREGKFRKEPFIQERVRADGLTDGLVAVLCVKETCRSVALKYGRGRPRLSHIDNVLSMRGP
jgi:hypothetical protein